MPEITNATIIDKDAAIAMLNTNNSPVIFWDTCSLLDIVRLPLPDRFGDVSTLVKLMEIKQKIVNGTIISLASKVTIAEYNRHILETESSVFRAAKKISNEFNSFVGFINKLVPSASIPLVDLKAFNIEEVLADIVQSIASKTLFIDEDDVFMRQATQRVFDRYPPAKAKSEFKDCYIWITCLYVRQNSTKQGKPFGFLSSNVNDYSLLPDKKVFVPELQAEATLADIEYFAGFNIAYGRLSYHRVI